MAEVVGFEGANALLSGEAAGCRDLECFLSPDGQAISCWRLTDEELKHVAQTGVVWLSVFGPRIPPVLVSGTALVEIGGRPAKAEPVLPKRKEN